MSETQKITGTVWAVFGHRFAVEGRDGRVLADLGPKGAEGLALSVGDPVAFTGERKPSEIRVTAIIVGDGAVREIAWPKKPHDDAADGKADPAAALARVRGEGYAIEGEAKRRPKHFEIVGSKDGVRHAIHVERDGTIRTAKPVAA